MKPLDFLVFDTRMVLIFYAAILSWIFMMIASTFDPTSSLKDATRTSPLLAFIGAAIMFTLLLALSISK